ncbi:hypothetical protein HDU83_008742 [Entophlyctis luteolus]|nr:hypothetical protein HDU83_008742 [Entophlyctis luteolus]
MDLNSLLLDQDLDDFSFPDTTYSADDRTPILPFFEATKPSGRELRQQGQQDHSGQQLFPGEHAIFSSGHDAEMIVYPSFVSPAAPDLMMVGIVPYPADGSGSDVGTSKAFALAEDTGSQIQPTAPTNSTQDRPPLSSDDRPNGLANPVSKKGPFELKQHDIIHQEIKRFECLECGKMFKRPMELRSHSLVHSPEKPYACDLCPAAYKRATDLKIHIIDHTNVREYEFGSESGRDQDRTKHSYVHSKELNFACTLCDRKFKTRKILNNHRATRCIQGAAGAEPNDATPALEDSADAEVEVKGL